MSMSFWLIVLGTAMLAIGVIVATILYERLTYDNKQEKYQRLHRQMGLENEVDSSRVVNFAPPDNR